jgi:hypothetical protein
MHLMQFPTVVIPHRGAWVSVGGRFLYVPQRPFGVECGRDERVPQRVRSDRLGDPGPAGHPAHDPRCAVTVQPPPITAAVTACHLRLPPRLAQFRNRPSYAGVL